MSKTSGAKDGLKVAQTGTPVPAKDFSTPAKGAKAAGKMSTAPDPITAPEPKKYQGSGEDYAQDYNDSRRRGKSSADYEDSAHDRITDKARGRQMMATQSTSADAATDYKPGNSHFYNKPKSSHGFGHASGNHDGKLRNSGHSCAHRIGKKK